MWRASFSARQNQKANEEAVSSQAPKGDGCLPPPLFFPGYSPDLSPIEEAF